MPGNDRKELAGAAAWVLVAAAGLRCLGLNRMLRAGSRMPARRQPAGGESAAATDPALAAAYTAVDRAGRALGANRCLTRSLALLLMLRRRGIEAEMRIGVDRDGPGLAAHAWLEHRGRVIGPASAAGRFPAVFPSIGAAR